MSVAVGDVYTLFDMANVFELIREEEERWKVALRSSADSNDWLEINI